MAEKSVAYELHHWYRERLGIGRAPGVGALVGLTISLKDTRPFLWQVYACADHPQVVVRLATWLGLLGFGLGVIGVGLGLLPMGEHNEFINGLAVGIVITGVAELLWSVHLVNSKRQ